MERNYRLKMLPEDALGIKAKSVENYGINDILSTGGKVRVNLIALGDVGTNVVMGLKLLGGDVIEEIGIYDINSKQLERLELEFNQMKYPPRAESLETDCPPTLPAQPRD